MKADVLSTKSKLINNSSSFEVKYMAFGLPAHFSESRKFPFERSELIAAAKSSLEKLGWPYQLSDEGIFIVKVHNSPMTFGEEITIDISSDGEIKIESICVEGGLYRMPQIFDFGANRQNADAFFAQFERVINEKSD